ncbi:MAG: DUF4340 domain-containing protein [Minwuia sp.]|uniref:DUF4340 domain-containing protein n=1 Tax=Minwuia sp. TaxID=2493630 RepID=UPI003A879965
MKSRNWIVLLIVTAIFAAGAVWSVIDRNRQLAEREYGEPLFPGLEGASANRVAELSVDTGHAAWTLKKEEGGRWVLAERNGYPADIDRVKEAVVALTNARIVAPRTSDPAKFARLDLEPPKVDLEKEGDVTSVRVTAKDADGDAMADLLIGRVKALPTSREAGQAYVRRWDEDQSWLVEGRFDIRKNPTAWLDKDLIKVKREEVRAISVARADGGVLDLARGKFGNLHVENLPEGRKEEDIRLTAAQRALEFLPFKDVKPAAEVDMTGAVVTTIRIDDGTTVTVRTVEAGIEVDKDPGYWITFDIAHDPSAVTPEADLPEPGPNDEGKKREIDVEAGAARAAKAKARADGWAYLFAEFTAQNFLHSLETVSSPKEDS